LKRNPKARVSAELLWRVWNDLREYYFLNTNKQNWETFIDNLKKIAAIENEITSCKAGEILVRYGHESGKETLEYWGINTLDESLIRSAILQRETKKRLVEARMHKGDKQEEVDFYEMLANIEMNLPHQIDIEHTSLERWCGILKGVNSKNKAEKAAYNKRK